MQIQVERHREEVARLDIDLIEQKYKRAQNEFAKEVVCRRVEPLKVTASLFERQIANTVAVTRTDQGAMFFTCDAFRGMLLHLGGGEIVPPETLALWGRFNILIAQPPWAHPNSRRLFEIGVKTGHCSEITDGSGHELTVDTNDTDVAAQRTNVKLIWWLDGELYALQQTFHENFSVPLREFVVNLIAAYAGSELELTVRTSRFGADCLWEET
jgi:hypothetical protein